MKLRVIADNKIPFLKGLLDPYCDIDYLPARDITHEAIADADALLIRTRTICNKNLLENTKVKFIASATIGFDHIDTQYCEQKGIYWTNAPGCNSGSVMQYVASALVSLQRQMGFRFSERTLGVIGYGNVGKKVVKLAELLGMRVVINDPPLAREKGNCGFVSFETLLKEADIITIHTPLNYDGIDKTFHLFDNQSFQKVQKNTLFINTSRGEVVDTQALIDAINNGTILYPVIDVWENEPAIDTTLLHKVFRGTPHIAGYSADGKSNATIMVVEELNRYFNLGIKSLNIALSEPKDSLITIDCNNLTFEDIMFMAITHTYDLTTDFNRLIANPLLFENLRDNYPLRREFKAYSVNAINCCSQISSVLSQLQFNII
jgi:erythronate-4-phosphate dehydrogenase